MNLATFIGLHIKAIGKKTSGLLTGSTARDNLDYLFTKSLADGTAIDTANQSYQRESTLSASATLTLDFAGGTTVYDAFGDAVAFARIKALYVENSSAVGGANITVGGNNGSAGAVTLAPGGVYFVMRPDATAWPIAGGTTDTVSITNASGSLTASYRLIIIGATA